jgi:uncharacterized protein involved in exopolysaccharide biosynthesis
MRQAARKANPALRPVPSLYRNRPQDAGLYDFFETLRRGFWFLALFPIATALAALAVLFLLLPPEYESRAVIIPLEPESTSQSVLTDLVEPLPLKLEFTERDESTSIVAFLQSMRLKALLIEKHGLLPVLYPRLWDDERGVWRVTGRKTPTVVQALQEEALDDHYEIGFDDDLGLVELAWYGRDSALCEEMLLSVIEELNAYLVNDYVSQATRERAFLEEQVTEAEAELKLWESRVPGPRYGAQTIARETLATQSVYVELRRRLALARIAEAERRPDFKVLDAPYLPVVWDKLPRILAVMLVFFGSIALALCALFTRRFFQELRTSRQTYTGKV